MIISHHACSSQNGTAQQFLELQVNSLGDAHQWLVDGSVNNMYLYANLHSSYPYAGFRFTGVTIPRERRFILLFFTQGLVLVLL